MGPTRRRALIKLNASGELSPNLLLFFFTQCLRNMTESRCLLISMGTGLRASCALIVAKINFAILSSCLTSKFNLGIRLSGSVIHLS